MESSPLSWTTNSPLSWTTNFPWVNWSDAWTGQNKCLVSFSSTVHTGGFNMVLVACSHPILPLHAVAGQQGSECDSMNSVAGAGMLPSGSNCLGMGLVQLAFSLDGPVDDCAMVIGLKASVGHGVCVAHHVANVIKRLIDGSVVSTNISSVFCRQVLKCWSKGESGFISSYLFEFRVVPAVGSVDEEGQDDVDVGDHDGFLKITRLSLQSSQVLHQFLNLNTNNQLINKQIKVGRNFKTFLLSCLQREEKARLEWPQKRFKNSSGCIRVCEVVPNLLICLWSCTKSSYISVKLYQMFLYICEVVPNLLIYIAIFIWGGLSVQCTETYLSGGRGLRNTTHLNTYTHDFVLSNLREVNKGIRADRAWTFLLEFCPYSFSKNWKFLLEFCPYSFSKKPQTNRQSFHFTVVVRCWSCGHNEVGCQGVWHFL